MDFWLLDVVWYICLIFPDPGGIFASLFFWVLQTIKPFVFFFGGILSMNGIQHLLLLSKKKPWPIASSTKTFGAEK